MSNDTKGFIYQVSVISVYGSSHYHFLFIRNIFIFILLLKSMKAMDFLPVLLWWNMQQEMTLFSKKNWTSCSPINTCVHSWVIAVVHLRGIRRVTEKYLFPSLNSTAHRHLLKSNKIHNPLFFPISLFWWCLRSSYYHVYNLLAFWKIHGLW